MHEPEEISDTGPGSIVVDCVIRLTRLRVDAELQLLAFTAMNDGPDVESEPDVLAELHARQLALRRQVQSTSEMCAEAEIALVKICNVYRRFCGSAGVQLTLPSFERPLVQNCASCLRSHVSTGHAGPIRDLPPFQYPRASRQDEPGPQSPDLFEPE
jgi:hypothetical protein